MSASSEALASVQSQPTLTEVDKKIVQQLVMACDWTDKMLYVMGFTQCATRLLNELGSFSSNPVKGNFGHLKDDLNGYNEGRKLAFNLFQQGAHLLTIESAQNRRMLSSEVIKEVSDAALKANIDYTTLMQMFGLGLVFDYYRNPSELSLIYSVDARYNLFGLNKEQSEEFARIEGDIKTLVNSFKVEELKSYLVTNFSDKLNKFGEDLFAINLLGLYLIKQCEMQLALVNIKPSEYSLFEQEMLSAASNNIKLDATILQPDLAAYDLVPSPDEYVFEGIRQKREQRIQPTILQKLSYDQLAIIFDSLGSDPELSYYRSKILNLYFLVNSSLDLELQKRLYFYLKDLAAIKTIDALKDCVTKLAPLLESLQVIKQVAENHKRDPEVQPLVISRFGLAHATQVENNEQIKKILNERSLNSHDQKQLSFIKEISYLAKLYSVKIADLQQKQTDIKSDNKSDPENLSMLSEIKDELAQLEEGYKAVEKIAQTSALLNPVQMDKVLYALQEMTIHLSSDKWYQTLDLMVKPLSTINSSTVSEFVDGLAVSYMNQIKLVLKEAKDKPVSEQKQARAKVEAIIKAALQHHPIQSDEIADKFYDIAIHPKYKDILTVSSKLSTSTCVIEGRSVGITASFYNICQSLDKAIKNSSHKHAPATQIMLNSTRKKWWTNHNIMGAVALGLTVGIAVAVFVTAPFSLPVIAGAVVMVGLSIAAAVGLYMLGSWCGDKFKNWKKTVQPVSSDVQTSSSNTQVADAAVNNPSQVTFFSTNSGSNVDFKPATYYVEAPASPLDNCCVNPLSPAEDFNKPKTAQVFNVSGTGQSSLPLSPAAH